MKHILLLIIAIVILVVLAGSIYFVWQISEPFDSQAGQLPFTVERGQTVKEIAANLVDQKIINGQFIFETYVYLKNLEKKFIAGQYQLSAAMNTKEIVGRLIFQSTSNEQTIRILEGWNIQEIGEYLANQGIVTQAEFLRVAQDTEYQLPDAKYSFLADSPPNATLEGYLFPDTYRIYNDAEAEDIIEKLLDNFDKKLTSEFRQEISQQNKTIFEIITMASLIEKEAATEEGRKIISGIFYKRLALGQALQSCATINYILGRPIRQLSFEETRAPSPYNTYLHPGLPPGPICNPGLAAIKAAIWPKKTAYQYFLSTPDGQTIYSRTKQEHDLNKVKYLK